MKKNNFIITLALVTVLAFSFLLTGCDNRDKYAFGEEPKFCEEQFLFLEAGEVFEYTLKDIREIFKHSGINISSFSLPDITYGIVTISDNKITAHRSGFTSTGVELYDKSAKTRHSVGAHHFLNIHVVDATNMIEIKTAEDLAAIDDNLSGHFILKNNIDLYNWGDWTPIEGFSGIFVNPGGFKISNLTINSSIRNGGLFGSAVRAYIDGIILENIKIDLSHYAGQDFFSTAGGIVASSQGSRIANSSVTGTIKAQQYVGGIVGFSTSVIINCSFDGIVSNIDSTKEVVNAAAGGIVGCYVGNGAAIAHSTATGQVSSVFVAGGVVGVVYLDWDLDRERSSIIINSYFIFTKPPNHVIKAPISNTVVGWYKDIM